MSVVENVPNLHFLFCEISKVHFTMETWLVWPWWMVSVFVHHLLHLTVDLLQFPQQCRLCRTTCWSTTSRSHEPSWERTPTSWRYTSDENRQTFYVNKQWLFFFKTAYYRSSADLTKKQYAVCEHKPNLQYAKQFLDVSWFRGNSQYAFNRSALPIVSHNALRRNVTTNTWLGICCSEYCHWCDAVEQPF